MNTFNVFRIVLSLLFITMTNNIIFSQETLQDFQSATRTIAGEAMKSVVTIGTTNTVKVKNNKNFFFFFNPFGQNDDKKGGDTQEYKQQGQGSGIIVRKKKNTYYVLTNAHVIEEADDITVSTYDNKVISAKLIGKDKGRDLALISFKSNKKIAIARMGNSNTVQPGDIVFAIGSPFGFTSSITFGIVSALGRAAKTRSPNQPGYLTEYIQSDAAVNQGNSGGPLVNINGEVIGINSWIYTRTGDNSGLSFAVPINNAIPAIDSFIQTGSVSYGWLGVFHASVNTDTMNSLTETNEGSFVSNIINNSPADKAGILPGDIIKQINSTPIKDTNDLTIAIAETNPGSRINARLLRNGKIIRINVVLGKRAENAENYKVWPGFTVIDIIPEYKKRFDISSKSGVFISSIMSGSIAAVSGLQERDVIERVNNKMVKNLKTFYSELNAIKANKEILFRINRGGNILIIGLVTK